jgi:hypothetical protein
MDLKEVLGRLTVPIKQKVNEDELIKAEENNLSEVILNVEIVL